METMLCLANLFLPSTISLLILFMDRLSEKDIHKKILCLYPPFTIINIFISRIITKLIDYSLDLNFTIDGVKYLFVAMLVAVIFGYLCKNLKGRIRVEKEDN